MPLESCMILLDNSEFMRNGDYVPTRLEAQQDAANLLVGAKTQSHPESTVGISAGTELLVSPTDDIGKLLTALHGLNLPSANAGGNSTGSGFSSDVTASVQVASLALKHRRNKNGSQRIVLFVGTPLEGVEPRALAKAGRQLKKNNIAIDVVALGELEINEPKLRELVNAANGRTSDDDAAGERTCHLVTIPAGVLPSDVLASSPIVHGGEGGGSAFAASAAAGAANAAADMGGNAFAEFGGVDPNMDPELAMALRVSMEEERARQERLAAQQASEANEGGSNADAEMTDANSGAPAAAPVDSAASSAAAAAADIGLSEEEALLQQALAMSMNENEPGTSPDGGGAEGGAEDSKPAAVETMETDDMDEEAAAMQMALQMSMQQNDDGDGATGEAGSAPAEEGKSTEFQDPKFVNELLGSLPGVNTNDPAIQNALRNLNADGDDKKDGEGKDDKDKKKDEEK